MANQPSPDARLFHHVAWQRFEEAEILFKNNKATGSVYLGGYGVECIFKCLLLRSLPVAKQKTLLQLFHGTKGHNLERLKGKLKHLGLALPPKVVPAFSRVQAWNTDWRYQAKLVPANRARAFLDAAADVLHWAETRM